MDIKTLAPLEAIEAVKEIQDITEVRNVANQLEVSFSGNSGIESLKTKVIDVLSAMAESEDDELTPPAFVPVTPPAAPVFVVEEEEEIQVAKAPVKKAYPIELLLTMDPSQEEDPAIRRLIIRAKALRLSRVKITNLDPADTALSGTIVTVVNKYIGKVSKFIPFGEEMENGYHVEEILLNRIRSQKFALRKEIKGNKFGVKQYKTVMVNKYSVEVLPPLNADELRSLAERQAAANSIG